MSRAAPSPDAAATPIGVFDSGLGGLTVVRALREALPAEDVIYLGDTARVPYGTRSAATVARYARGCAHLLVERGIKLLVVACNTVSAVALDVLRDELALPVVGVVEPGARAAVEAAEAWHAARGVGREPIRIGVLGTVGTIGSGAYPRAVAALGSRFEVRSRAAPLLVPLVEEGWVDGDVPRLAVERYLTPLLDEGCRVIVLGCTHYPLLRGTIAEVADRHCAEPVDVVDSAHAAAAAVAELLRERSLRRDGARVGRLELLATDLPRAFGAVVARFLGGDAPDVEPVDIAPA
jgi:glutamate racemase